MERFHRTAGLLLLALPLVAPCAIAKDKNPEHDPDRSRTCSRGRTSTPGRRKG